MEKVKKQTFYKKKTFSKLMKNKEQQKYILSVEQEITPGCTCILSPANGFVGYSLIVSAKIYIVDNNR